MNRPYTVRAVYKHPKGRSRCLVFDEQLEFAKFLHCQNQGARKRLCPWCHPHPIRSTIRQSICVGTFAKLRIFCYNHALFEKNNTKIAHFSAWTTTYCRFFTTFACTLCDVFATLSTPILSVCRKWGRLSQLLQRKFSGKIAGQRKLSYLCTVKRNKRHSSDIKKRINKISNSK